MFVFSVRSSTIKFFALVLGTLLLLVTLVSVGSEEATTASVGGISVNFGDINSNEERIAFIESFGVKVKAEPHTEESFTSPDALDSTVSGYNEIQLSQGLDLTKYRGKRITHYAYEVTNYNSPSTVYVNLFIHKGRVVGCDVSSVEGEGFVLPLVGLDKGNLK